MKNASEIVKRDLKDVTILIVDDEPALRKAIAFDFKRKGYNVLEATNGREAFDLVKTNRIDVVISDIRMPGGDGVELLDSIKSINPEIPVVMFVTGFADISLDDAYAKGADAVFSKPFDRKALFDAVTRAISSKDALWGQRKLERVEVDFSIDLNFPDLGIALQGKVLNIGRGGFFVALESQFPTPAARTSFSIQFDTGALTSIRGDGIVRWVRSQGGDNKRAGCGIEFGYLDDSSRGQIIQLINQLKTKSFIPNT